MGPGAIMRAVDSRRRRHRWTSGPIAAAFLTCAGAADATELVPTRPFDVSSPSAVQVAEQPTDAELLRAFPPEGRTMKGFITVACVLTEDGHPTACEVESVTPPGQGFEAAAFRVASLVRFTPRRDPADLMAGLPVRISMTLRSPMNLAEWLDWKLARRAKPKPQPPAENR